MQSVSRGSSSEVVNKDGDEYQVEEINARKSKKITDFLCNVFEYSLWNVNQY